MFRRLIILIFVYSFGLSFAQVSSDAVLGKWMATDKSVAVEVFKVDEKYRAKVIWFDEKLGSGKPMHERIDDENPNPSLRNRKILGMEVLHGLRYDPKNESWEKGRIYDATSGRTWDSSAKLHNGILKVRGFWKFKWIGKSLDFKKIKDENYTKK